MGNSSETAIRKAQRKFRWILTVQVLWLALVCLMGFWWGKLVLNQAQRIDELEKLTGIVDSVRGGYSARTSRMLFWESSFFFGLLIAITAFLVWYHWRDMKRTRGMQAFFASVTHELRTPLTSIRLQAESISDLFAAKLDQKDSTLVNRLLEDTVRLESQVERTLELARVEGGGPVFVRSVDLKSWLDRMVRVSLEVYKSKVLFEVNVERIFVEADPFALQMILKNLVENSIRHSKRVPVLIKVASLVSASECILQVSDNGCGFEGNRASLGKLFEKGSFSQGSGVGLYLTAALIKRMGGKVKFVPDQNGFMVQLSLRLSMDQLNEEQS